jgi:hypothetical protein
LRLLLRLNSEATEFELTSAPLPSKDTEIAVQTRSIIDLLKNMAAQVEVLPEDSSQHRAFPGFETGHDVPGVVPLIRTRSSKQKPNDAFVTASKYIFAQLMELVTMIEVGSKQSLPVVTIPAH